MQLVKEGDWDAATKCAESAKQPLSAKLVLWSKYKDRNSNAKTEDILSFISKNPTFPNLLTLQAVAENKINKKTNVAFLRHWFTKHHPITDRGTGAYLEVMGGQLEHQDLVYWVKKAWVNVDYNQSERQAFLSRYRKYLTHSDHVEKLDKLIWKGYTSIDKDLLGLVNHDYKALFIARLELLKNNGNMTGVIAKVPDKLKAAPGLLYARAVWHQKRGQYSKIAKLIADHPHIKTSKSDRWFELRSRTAIELAQKGRYKESYDLASTHQYQSPINYVDGEWFAGKVAWIYNKDARKALNHFKRILDKAQYSVTISKSAYWSGMMHDKLGEKEDAKKHFTIASQHPHTFYGLLGVMKVGDNKVILEKPPVVTQEDKEWIAHNELVQASKILALSKQHNAARHYVGVATKHADTPGKQYLLTKFGEDNKLNSLSVLYNKVPERKGKFLGASAYPTLGGIKSFNKNVEEALSLSIIRQESEFDPYALSPAGAMGLMQLMYPTAKQMSKELKESITREDLDSPEVNVKLGTYYLSKLLKKYEGHYVLTIASYNAGPGKVDEWIKVYGDPRVMEKADDVVEWIERTPFYETRSYIQHVLSNLQMYRNFLGSNSNDQHTDEIAIDLAPDLLKKH